MTNQEQAHPSGASPASGSEEPGSKLQLGTFLGVFTPTVLTILGVMMYLRIGWVVGGIGLGQTLVIVIGSNVITFITALSLSSLATNMRMGVGGAYYLISRSFGLEVGGAIGIPLYLSQTLSVTLYAFGMAESFAFVLPDMITTLPGFLPVTAALIIVGVSSVAAKSTELSLNLQRPIMLLIALSLWSLLAGVDWAERMGALKIGDVLAGGTGNLPFWTAFAVFFPAVTGILSGVSLSGDLKDPGRSIPRGVLSAVSVGLVVYLVVSVGLFVGVGADKAALVDETNLVWMDIAVVPWLVLPGLWGAVLSSAFGSILSAPRTLQALAFDRLAPRMFTRTDPQTGEPVFGLVVSAAVALLAVGLGNLNAVAEWLTVFFLTTYGALNAIAFFEIAAGDSSFRPRIRVPWAVALVGAIGCMVAMFAINPVACMGAVTIELGIFLVIRRRSLRATWGDVRNGLWLSMARFALLHLREQKLDARSWRPHILFFTEDLEKSILAMRLWVGFGQQRGLVTAVTLKVGELDDNDEYKLLAQRNKDILEKHRLAAFTEVAAVPKLVGGVLTVAQSNGFAGLSSNTVAFSWQEAGEKGIPELLKLVRKLDRLDKCTLICRNPLPARRNSTFLVWWAGKENNGDLMLLLAHLLANASGWENSRIVLRTIVDTEEELEARRDEFLQMIEEIRIGASVEVIQKMPDESVTACIINNSQAATMSFIGLSVPEPGEEEAFADRLTTLTDGISSTIMVRNAGPYRGRLL